MSRHRAHRVVSSGGAARFSTPLVRCGHRGSPDIIAPPSMPGKGTRRARVAIRFELRVVSGTIQAKQPLPKATATLCLFGSTADSEDGVPPPALGRGLVGWRPHCGAAGAPGLLHQSRRKQLFDCPATLATGSDFWWKIRAKESK